MPKNNGPRKQNCPRKRTGCITCKTAHVRCTEERPDCERCARLKLGCKYETRLLWAEDARRRGIVHGREGVWSKRSNKSTSRKKRKLDEAPEPLPNALVEPAHFVGGADGDDLRIAAGDFTSSLPSTLLAGEREWTGTDHTVKKAPPTSYSAVLFLMPGSVGNVSQVATRCDTVNSDESSGQSSRFPASTTSSDIFISHALLVFSLKSSEVRLMDYYTHFMAPKRSLSSNSSPYLDVLLPIAYEFAPLRERLLGALACQLYHISGEKTYEVESLKRRSRAMRGLNEHLSSNCMDWKSLVTVVMFCLRDITDGCEPSWITHLKMGLCMLKELKCNTRTDADLRGFCEIYLVAHEVMGRTAWEDDNKYVEAHHWEMGEEYHQVCKRFYNLSMGLADYFVWIDGIMGCSREPISIISQISLLAANMRTENSLHPASTHIIRAFHLLDQLSSLRQIRQPGFGDERSLIQIAEIKRLSAVLYLQSQVFSRLSFSNHVPPISCSMQNLQVTIIDALQKLPSSSGAALWPLFMLGKSSMRNGAHLNFVLDRLAQLEKSRYLGSVYHARRNIARVTSRGEDWAVYENERWVSLP